MTDTDRKKIKDQQKGYFVTAAGISTPSDEVNYMHRRTKSHFLLSGGSTTANIAEKVVHTVFRKSKLVASSWTATGALTSNAENYAKITVYKRTNAGATQTALASWNVAIGGEGTTVALANNVMTLSSTVADLTIDAGSVITYAIIKYGAAGQTIGEMNVSVDLEEV